MAVRRSDREVERAASTGRPDRGAPGSSLERPSQREQRDHAARTRSLHDAQDSRPAEANDDEIGNARLRERQAGSVGGCEKRARAARMCLAKVVTCFPGGGGSGPLRKRERLEDAEMGAPGSAAQPRELARGGGSGGRG